MKRQQTVSGRISVDTLRTRIASQRTHRSGQSGYALLLVFFMMTVLLITSTAVLLDRRTEGRRQREDQMIWRGQQFVRAIRLFYRKAGHYPADLDTLEKGVGDLHFIRPEALVDPMNKTEDGKWRFVYTNPTGQILGSVRYATMQQMAVLDLYSAQVAALQKAGSDSNQDNSGPADQTGSSDQTGSCPPGTSMMNASNTMQPPVAQSMTTTPGQVLPPGPAQTSPFNTFSIGGSQPGLGAQAQSGCMAQLAGMPPMAPAALQALLQMKPTGPVDSPVIGGFLVGVGSTVDRASVKIYKGGKKYKDWEFIYNPIEEQALAVAQGLGQGGAGGLMGAPGIGNGLPGPATTATGGIGTAPIQAPPSQPQPPQQQDQQQ